MVVCSISALGPTLGRSFLNHYLRQKLFYSLLSSNPYTLFIYFFKDFIYLFDRETTSKRGNTSRGSGRGRSRLPAEEPDVGLDPRMLGSRPEPKAGAQQLRHPGAPEIFNF